MRPPAHGGQTRFLHLQTLPWFQVGYLTDRQGAPRALHGDEDSCL